MSSASRARSNGSTPSRSSCRARAGVEGGARLVPPPLDDADRNRRLRIEGCLQLLAQALVEAPSAIHCRRRQQHSDLLGAAADDDVPRSCDAFESAAISVAASRPRDGPASSCTAISTSVRGRCVAPALAISRSSSRSYRSALPAIFEEPLRSAFETGIEIHGRLALREGACPDLVGAFDRLAQASPRSIPADRRPGAAARRTSAVFVPGSPGRRTRSRG